MNILITGRNGVVSRELYKHFKKKKILKYIFLQEKKQISVKMYFI